MNIFNFFPYEAPRKGQSTVLKWIEKNWDKYDVFVLQAPVAAGKSGLAVTIAGWANWKHGTACSITTPDNVLVKQYRDDFKLPTLKRVNQFISREHFNKAKQKFIDAETKLMNNYTLLANRVYSPVQIMDEAHELIPMLQDFEGIKIWQHIDYYPDGLRTAADVLLWSASLPNDDSKKKKIEKHLSRNPLDYTIVHEEEMYRGNIRKCLRIYPLTPKNNAPILWPPSKVKKLILMSATISGPDVVDLGLNNRRVGFIEVPSDIPAKNRPFEYLGVTKMGRKRSKAGIDKCAKQLDSLAQIHEGRGFIHATYELSKELEKQHPGKFVHHTAANKNAKLSEWLANKDEQRSFVGCGLTTGLDLKGDICHWQAILKVQFPDLGDPAVMAKATQSQEWYLWQTAKQVVQAYGRVCRAPDDFGATYMLDSDFTALYSKGKTLLPSWFKEAFIF